MLVFVVFVFDFMNGFYDVVNLIVIVVLIGVLKFQQVVVFVVVFNVIVYFIFYLKVVQIVGKGMIDFEIVDYYVVFGVLVGVIGWNVIMWYYGILLSLLYVLIGGFVGVVFVKLGWSLLNVDGLLKMIVFIFILLLFGFIFGLLFMFGVLWLYFCIVFSKVDWCFCWL